MKTKSWQTLVALAVVAFASVHAQVPAGPPLDYGPQTQGPGAAPASISQSAAEVVRLAEASVSEDVLAAYVQNCEYPFNLSDENVQYLKDLGLPPTIITAMLNHDDALAGQAQPPPATVPAEVVPAPQPAPPPPAPAPLPAYVSDAPPVVSCFYNDLSPYGTWVELPGYGWCWQPRVVAINRAWHPYCDNGHWVWTDAGWFWQSDYTWGWAPFHYGRWAMHQSCGWVWVPDNVWAPAWVTWRVAEDRCGWAPLPPRADFDLQLGFRFNGLSVRADFDFGLRPEHFTFVALNSFRDRDLGPRRLPPGEVTRIYNRTTVINNYAANNTILNPGVAVERVAAATHRPIAKIAIRDTASPARLTRTSASGKTETAVYRPKLAPPAQPVHMVAQKLDERQPMVRPAPLAPADTRRPAPPVGVSASAPGARRPPMENTRPQPPVAAQAGPTARPHPQPTPAERTAAQPTAEKSAPSPTAASTASRPATPTHQPAPTVLSSPTAVRPAEATAPTSAATASRPAAPTHQPAPIVPSSRTAVRPAEVTAPTAATKPPARSAGTSQPSATVPGYSLHTVSQGKASPVQAASSTQNPHQYAPKSTQQAAEVRPVPQPNRPSPPPNSRPAPTSGSSAAPKGQSK